jgi:hypothetical protein
MVQYFSSGCRCFDTCLKAAIYLSFALHVAAKKGFSIAWHFEEFVMSSWAYFF